MSAIAPLRSAVTRAAVLVVLSTLVATSSPRSAWSAEEAGVGVVVDYKPAARPFSIRRQGGSNGIANIGAVVQAGDQIEVPASGSIDLLLSDDAIHPFSGPGTFVVPATRPIALIGRILRGLGIASHGPDA